MMKIKDVWDHIETTNHELGAVKEDIATIRADVRWLKNFIPPLAILSGILAAMISRWLT